MSGDFDMAAFEAFVRDFLAGNLEPYLKSEPLPADGNAGEKKRSFSYLSIDLVSYLVNLKSTHFHSSLSVFRNPSYHHLILNQL